MSSQQGLCERCHVQSHNTGLEGPPKAVFCTAALGSRHGGVQWYQRQPGNPRFTSTWRIPPWEWSHQGFYDERDEVRGIKIPKQIRQPYRIQEAGLSTDLQIWKMFLWHPPVVWTDAGSIRTVDISYQETPVLGLAQRSVLCEDSPPVCNSDLCVCATLGGASWVTAQPCEAHGHPSAVTSVCVCPSWKAGRCPVVRVRSDSVTRLVLGRCECTWLLEKPVTLILSDIFKAHMMHR